MTPAGCLVILLSFYFSLSGWTRPRRRDLRAFLGFLGLTFANLVALPLFYSPRDLVASDRIMFERASAGINLTGTVRCFLAGARRYFAYIAATRDSIRLRIVRALLADSA